MRNAPGTLPSRRPRHTAAAEDRTSLALEDPLHIFTAGQFLGLLQAISEPGARLTMTGRKLQDQCQRYRKQLYRLAFPQLLAAGYDPSRCTEPTVRAHAGGQGQFRLFLEWFKLPEDTPIGAVIPTAVQPLRMPQFTEEFSVLEAGETIDELVAEDDPLQGMLLNVQDWIVGALDDIEYRPKGRTPRAHWKCIVAGVDRMGLRLEQLLREGVPMVPEHLEDFLLPLSTESRDAYQSALQTAPARTAAAYQLIVRLLQASTEDAGRAEHDAPAQIEHLIATLRRTEQQLRHRMLTWVLAGHPGIDPEAVTWHPKDLRIDSPSSA